MKIIKVFILLILLTFFLSSCYESKYPISGIKDSVNPELAGNWTGENFPAVKVIPISENDYFVMFSNKKNDVISGKAYSIKIGSTNIIVFQELSSGKNNYWFFKLSYQKISNTYTMTVQSINNKFIEQKQPKNHEELQDIITKNIENDIMFDTPQTFLKLVNTNLKEYLYFPDEN